MAQPFLTLPLQNMVLASAFAKQLQSSCDCQRLPPRVCILSFEHTLVMSHEFSAKHLISEWQGTSTSQQAIH
jgi:hypothetical protein